MLAPRLWKICGMDYLCEEAVRLNLRAASIDAAIAALVEALLEAHPGLQGQRDSLLSSALQREAEISTCFGQGLAVPHGTLEAGSPLVAALGLFPEGLAVDTPDDIPVYYMVLLATPADQRREHIKVLADLARRLGQDPERGQRLRTARSASEAWSILSQ
jgi:mannitol/fructose-specific phosphotransferase system IIA component (Ntr-type)